MSDTVDELAHSLIAAHGADAIAMAEKAAANVHKLNLPERSARWTLIIAAVKALQAADKREVL